MSQAHCPSCGAPPIADVLAELEQLRARVDALEGRKPVKASPATDFTFTRFWDAYPRKVGKMDAARAWAQLRLPERNAALDAVARYSTIWASAPDDRKVFIPYPSTWIRHCRWEDGEEEWKRAALGTKAAPAPRVTAALVGQNRNPGPAREVTDDSPEWVRETARAIASTLRPDVPDELAAAYFDWRNGKDATPPEDWSMSLTLAWEEVGR